MYWFNVGLTSFFVMVILPAVILLVVEELRGKG
jgi:hypothetical protein